MKVLVTGSTGFIGAQLCRALVDRGDDVRAFHRPTSHLRPLEGLQVERVEGDLTRPDTLLPAVQGVDVVFHTAGMTSGRRRHSGQLYTVNVEGTRNLLQAARFANVGRMVVTSSAAALGIPPRTPGRLGTFTGRETSAFLMHERMTWQSRGDVWPYGYSKYLAEIEVQRVISQGMDVVIVNPTLVLGPGDYHRRASSIVVQAALRRVPVHVEGGLNVVHIKDTVAGHLAALEHGKKGCRYILGGENLTYEALLQLIASTAGVEPPKSVLPTTLLRWSIFPLRMVSPFVSLPVSPHLLHLAGRHFYYAIRKAQAELQLPPPQPARESVADAYRWFCDVGALTKRKEKTTDQEDDTVTEESQ